MLNVNHSTEKGGVAAMSISPVEPHVSSVFIPVSQIEAARDWYCNLMGITTPCEIMNGHLCILPTKGVQIILDTMPMWKGSQDMAQVRHRAPAVMLRTDDIEASYSYVKECGIEVMTEIEQGHWFVIKDGDENLLMICS